MSHATIASQVANLERDDYRDRSIGASKVSARLARQDAARTRAVRTKNAKIEKRGYVRLSAVIGQDARTGQDVTLARVAIRSIESVAVQFPGLDQHQVTALALARVARGMVRAPIDRDDPARVARVIGRSMRAARRVAGRMATGRGTMPRVFYGLRGEATPNFALWTSLAPSVRTDTRCWCHRGEGCDVHENIATNGQGEKVGYRRDVLAPFTLGKAGQDATWLADNYREPGQVDLLAISARVNTPTDHAALLAQFGETESVGDENGRYVRTLANRSVARKRFNLATGETDSWRAYPARLAHAIGKAERASQVDISASIAAYMATMPASKVEPARVPARPTLASQPDALRIELGARAWHYLARVETPEDSWPASQPATTRDQWSESMRAKYGHRPGFDL